MSKFNPFTFKVITDKERLTSVRVLFILYMSHSFFVHHFLHYCLLL